MMKVYHILIYRKIFL